MPRSFQRLVHALLNAALLLALFIGPSTSSAAALAPIPSSISPASGPVAGGTPITISGADFVTGAAVTIGGAAATSVSVVDADTIKAVTPPENVGLQTVRVTNPDGQLGQLALSSQCTDPNAGKCGFYYQASPSDYPITISGRVLLNGTTPMGGVQVGPECAGTTCVGPHPDLSAADGSYTVHLARTPKLLGLSVYNASAGTAGVNSTSAVNVDTSSGDTFTGVDIPVYASTLNLVGTVTDACTGAGIGNASILLSVNGPSGAVGLAGVTGTDGNGHFALKIAPGTYDADVSAGSQYGRDGVRDAHFPSGGTLTEDFRLQPTGACPYPIAITGRVVNGTTPVAGVGFSSYCIGGPDCVSQPDRTASDGSFTIHASSALVALSVYNTPSGPGVNSTQAVYVDTSKGNSITGLVVPVASSTAQLSGTITDACSGAPIGSAGLYISVPLNGGPAGETGLAGLVFTAGDGNFALRLAPATYSMTLMANGYQTAHIGDLHLAGDLHLPPFQLQPTGACSTPITISGRVLNGTAPVANAFISAEGAAQSPGAPSGPDGAYVTHTGRGQLSLAAYGNGYSSVALTPVDATTQSNITGVDLQVVAVTTQLIGDITDAATGAGIDHTTLVLMTPPTGTGPSQVLFRIPTDANGRFSEMLPPGPFVLQASVDSAFGQYASQSRSVTFSGGTSTQDFALSSTAPPPIPSGNLVGCGPNYHFASCSANGEYGDGPNDAAWRGADGDLGTQWSSLEHLNSWWQATFPQPASVSQVAIWGRGGGDTLSGKLEFSDGSSVDFGTLPADGCRRAISFPPRTSSFVRFQVTGMGNRNTTGFREIEAYATPRYPDGDDNGCGGPASPPANSPPSSPCGAWQVGDIVCLSKGTRIYQGPTSNFGDVQTTVPVDNWAVKVIGGPRDQFGWRWWATSRKEAGDPSGGTGWVPVEPLTTPPSPPQNPPTNNPPQNSGTAPILPSGTQPQVNQIIGLPQGTQIRTGPGLGYPSTIPAQWGSAVPVQGWAVKVIKGPVCADGWEWWAVDRGAVDGSGGTGWAALTPGTCSAAPGGQPPLVGYPPRPGNDQPPYTLGTGIQEEYRRLDGANGVLGASTSSEFDASASPQGTSGRVARFANGSIYWSKPTDAHAVYGAIAAVFESMGGTTSWLGFPTDDAFTDASTGHLRQNFQGGYIAWNGSGYQAYMATGPVSAPPGRPTVTKPYFEGVNVERDSSNGLVIPVDQSFTLNTDKTSVTGTVTLTNVNGSDWFHVATDEVAGARLTAASGYDDFLINNFHMIPPGESVTFTVEFTATDQTVRIHDYIDIESTITTVGYAILTIFAPDISASNYLSWQEALNAVKALTGVRDAATELMALKGASPAEAAVHVAEAAKDIGDALLEAPRDQDLVLALKKFGVTLDAKTIAKKAILDFDVAKLLASNIQLIYAQGEAHVTSLVPVYAPLR